MGKKITVELSDEAEDYLNELLYSLDGKDGKPATIAECINESLETLSAFESATSNQLRNWNSDFVKLRIDDLKEFASNPTEELEFNLAERMQRKRKKRG